MKITINARKVFVNSELSGHIEKKLSKFDKFFGDDAEVSAKLSRVRDTERVEVTIQSGGTLFRSEAEDATFMNALDSCIYAIERQIRKNKTRLQKKLRDNIRIPEHTEEAREEEHEEEGAFSIRTKTFDFKPMTAEEAILQMNLLEHEFYVFTDTDTGSTCVVYKRKDGGYGLITPNRA